MELRISLGEVFLSDDGHFRTTRSVQPLLAWRPAAGWELRLRGDWTLADFYDAEAPAEQDRDGLRQGVSLEVLRELDGGWAAGVLVAFRRLDTEGSDWEGSEREVGLRLAAPEMSGLRPSLVLGIVAAPFANLHSLTGFTDERNDRRLYATLAIAVPALERSACFVPTILLRFERWDSNIAEFDFTRWEPRIEFGFSIPL